MIIIKKITAWAPMVLFEEAAQNWQVHQAKGQESCGCMGSGVPARSACPMTRIPPGNGLTRARETVPAVRSQLAGGCSQRQRCWHGHFTPLSFCPQHFSSISTLPATTPYRLGLSYSFIFKGILEPPQWGGGAVNSWRGAGFSQLSTVNLLLLYSSKQSLLK